MARRNPYHEDKVNPDVILIILISSLDFVGAAVVDNKLPVLAHQITHLTVM